LAGYLSDFKGFFEAFCVGWDFRADVMMKIHTDGSREIPNWL
jgi:hypothetical protein